MLGLEWVNMGSDIYVGRWEVNRENGRRDILGELGDIFWIIFYFFMWINFMDNFLG
jgi:hypothetical protein